MFHAMRHALCAMRSCGHGHGIMARKCRHCGHHEIGIVTKNGNFIALKPGDNVALVKD